MIKSLKIGLLASSLICTFAWATPHLGIWVYGSDGAVYEIKKSAGVTLTLPGIESISSSLTARLTPFNSNDQIGTAIGVNYYPQFKTLQNDESAMLTSRWDKLKRVLNVEYSNHQSVRKMQSFKPPLPLLNAHIEDVFFDSQSNLYWITEDLGGTKIFHENYRNDQIPVNELNFGRRIKKVRSNVLGDGLLVLLDNYELLSVSIDQKDELQVTEVNQPTEFKVLDFAVGPLGSKANEFFLVTQGFTTSQTEPEIFLHDRLKLQTKQRISPEYVSEINSNFTVPLKPLYGIASNVHFTELQLLVSTSPDRLNRFYQAQLQIQQQAIRNWMDPNSFTQSGMILDLSLIGRKVVTDKSFPTMCRYIFSNPRGINTRIYFN